MSSLKSLILSVALALSLVAPAQAVTLANFSITDGDWIVADDDTLTITGEFAANITGLMFPGPESFGPTPVLYSTTVQSGGAVIFQEDVGPTVVNLSPPVPVGALAAGLGWGEAAFAYLVAGEDRVDPGPTFNLGSADLFFTYTLGPSAAPGTFVGNFRATLTRAASGLLDPTLADMINDGHYDLTLLGVMGSASTGDSGNFETQIIVTAVPLPAGVLFLVGGLMGLALIRRRPA